MERKIVCKDLYAVQAELLICAEPSPERDAVFAHSDAVRMTDAANRHRDCAPLSGYWTPGFDLYARQVLHMVIPENSTEEELRSAYRCALRLAGEKNPKSAAIALFGREQLGLEAACRAALEETAPAEEKKPSLLYLAVSRDAFKRMK